MKKYRFYGGLFVTLLLITTRCSYLTNNITNTPPLEQAKHAQAQLLAIQTTPDKKSSQLLRFLKKYKRKISGILGLLRHWNIHRPDKKSSSRRIGDIILKARVRFGSPLLIQDSKN